MLAKSVLEQKCVKYKRNIENLLQRPGKRKNMKKPGRKSKQYRNELIRIAAEAREHGMSYGQYVGIYEYQKGMKI